MAAQAESFLSCELIYADQIYPALPCIEITSTNNSHTQFGFAHDRNVYNPCQDVARKERDHLDHFTHTTPSSVRTAVCAAPMATSTTFPCTSGALTRINEWASSADTMSPATLSGLLASVATAASVVPLSSSPPLAAIPLPKSRLSPALLCLLLPHAYNRRSSEMTNVPSVKRSGGDYAKHSETSLMRG